MKYPRLPEELDLRRKLLSKQIEEIRERYEEVKSSFARSAEVSRALKLGLPLPMSRTRWLIVIAGEYGVSRFQIWYWVNEEYRSKKRDQSKHSGDKEKIGEVRYKLRMKRETTRKRARIHRYAPLVLWEGFQSAKHEKRHRRISVKGIPLNEL